MLTLWEHQSTPPVFNGFRVSRSLVFCVVLCRSLLVLFLLAIVLSFLLRSMLADYRFGNVKVFFVTANIPSLNTTFKRLSVSTIHGNNHIRR